MTGFLTTEWLRSLDQAVRSDPELAEQAADLHLVVEQRVEAEGPNPPVVFHLIIDHGAVAVHEGPLPRPRVTFTQSRSTARAISSGEASAQRAFMTGSLRVGGDLQALLGAQSVLLSVGDAFSSVRAATDFGPGGRRLRCPNCPSSRPTPNASPASSPAHRYASSVRSPSAL